MTARDVYDPVPHSHVVPTGYLKAWAHGKQIAMRRVGGSVSQVIGIRDAGVRKNFYRRDRPATGETIYDIEWSLQQAETAALPIISTSHGDGRSISKTRARSASSSPSSIFVASHFGNGTRDRLLPCS